MTSTSSNLSQAQVAWRGTNVFNGRAQLFKYAWENPRPESILESLDFRSEMTAAAPFFIAMTLDDDPLPRSDATHETSVDDLSDGRIPDPRSSFFHQLP